MKHALSACLLVAGCGGGAGDADPVAATREFLSAVNGGDCARAWAYYSSGTQRNIRDELRRIEREAESATPGVTAETRYCQGSYGDYKRGSARLVSASESEATVAVTFSEGTHLALIPFLSTPYREYGAEMRLSKEDGHWKIERPRARIGREGWKLVEVGAVDVAYSLHGDPNRRLVEARALVRVPREALQKALMQPDAWPRLLPEVTQAEVLASDPARQKLKLRFAEWEHPIEVTAKAYGSLVNERLPWAELQWSADERPGRVLFTGSWKLQPASHGTWVALTIVIEPRQWPAGLAERVLAAERVAGAVDALGARAAR